jgi:hypothetical protein
MKMKLLIASLLPFCFLFGYTQKTTPDSYIRKYAPIAILESNRSGVPASITLAQGILESESGNSELAQKSNNHFGIKCKDTWQGEKVYHDDDASGECFRKYPSVEDSYKDHSDFLKNNSRYASLFQLEKTDYAGWARGLKKAGYATNPFYAQKLIGLIERYKLQTFDNPPTESPVKEPEQVGLKTPEKKKEGEPIRDYADMKQPEKDETIEEETDFAKILYINETKAIRASAGTAWLRIAEKFSLPLNRLLEYNDLQHQQTDILEKNQIIFLQRKKKQGASPYHIVQEQETLHEICQTEGIRLEQLLRMNKLQKNDQPKTGTKLILKSR